VRAALASRHRCSWQGRQRVALGPLPAAALQPFSHMLRVLVAPAIEREGQELAMLGRGKGPVLKAVQASASGREATQGMELKSENK
jgi:hypothetical protein